MYHHCIATVSHYTKKIFFFIISAILLLCNSVTTFAQSSEDTFFYGEPETVDQSTNFHGMIQDDVVQANDGVLKKILRVFNLDQFTTLSDASALEFVKYILNIALGLVSFAAVVIIIYGFVQVIFAKDEDGVTEARKIVQGAAIAIGIIAISRFIVSFLFSLYDQFVTT